MRLSTAPSPFFRGRCRGTCALSRADLTRGVFGICIRYFHGITDTWIAPGAPSPPTDLMA